MVQWLRGVRGLQLVDIDISVVTISFNQVGFLRECMDSVLSQDNCRLEYIVVDPGSTDGSRDLISSYGTAVRAVLEEDDGPADGLNRGFSLASGRLFYYLNSDDFVYPGTFERALERFDSLRCDVIYGDADIVDARGARVRSARSSRLTLARSAMGASVVLQQATFIGRSAYVRSGGFNVDNRTCWDAELLLSIAAEGAIFAHVPEPWAAFRVHEGSITGSGRVHGRYVQDRSRLARRYGPAWARRLGERAPVVGRVVKAVDNSRYSRLEGSVWRV